MTIARRIDELAPDGVIIVVNWERFTPGTSVFIPCMNTTEAIKQMNQVCREKGITTRSRARVENHMWGVRFWRLS